VTAGLALAGVVLAWLGVSLLTLSEGRRGLALGLALAGLGLAAGAVAAGRDPLAAAILAAGGAGAAAGRLRGGGGWGLLPPGSTPRLIAAIVLPVVAALVAGPVVETPAGAALLGALVVALGATGHLLTVARRGRALAAAAALALALGALGGEVALVTGGLVATALSLVDAVWRAETAE